MNIRTIRAITLMLLCAAFLACRVVSAAAQRPRYSPEAERNVGKRAGAEVDKSYDRVDNKEALAKLQKMADTIAANTPRSDVKYEVRLVKEKKPRDEPEVNAFSLPGGIIYITEGLLAAVQSDHELAGVVAHEITHNVNYDGLDQAGRANKIFKGEMYAVLAAMLIGGIDNDDWTHVAHAGMYYRQGVLGGYSIEMEKRADRGGVQYLLNTPWDPVGLLTFMERLAAEERRNPPPPMGIFQSHPLSIERVAYLIGHLQNAGVRINRRHTTEWPKPSVEEQEVNGSPAHVVLYRDQRIFACNAPAGEAKDAAERAAKIAEALTAALADGARTVSFAVGRRDGKPALLAFRDRVIFCVGDADAALAGKSAKEVATDAYHALRIALHEERIDRMY